MKSKADKSVEILKQVQQTLNVFDEPDDTGPNPFLYTRIMSKIESQEAMQQSGMGFFVPAPLRLPLIALIITLNLITGVLVFSNYQIQYRSDVQEIETIAKDYYLNNEEFIHY